MWWWVWRCCRSAAFGYCISDPLMESQSVQGVSGGCQPVVQAAALQGVEQGAATQEGWLGCPLRFLSPG